MAFEFVETFLIEVPEIQDRLNSFKEFDFKESHGLVVEVAAIHEGVTNNYTFYPAKELADGLESWLKPYPKPVLINHDIKTEPLGRVLGAKMDKEADGTPYVRLQLAITDPDAILKIKDKRYLTGSIGGSAEKAICSISGVNLAESAPKYRRGKHYKGKLAYVIMEEVSFKEYSFVNAPSDERSSVISITESIESNEEWVNKARFFCLDMNKEDIVEISESDENHDILSEMKKKDASSLYRTMKGAFIEAQVVNKLQEEGVNTNIDNTNLIDVDLDSNQEKDMTKTDTVEISSEEDNILEALDSLDSDDTIVEENVETEEEVETVEEEVEAQEEESTEESETATEEASTQEKDKGKDVDPETSQGAPKAREEDESEETVAEETAQEESVETVEEETEEISEAENTTEETQEAELDNEEEAIELQVEVSVEEFEALKEENAKLKAAVHRFLAEKVVDQKLRLGMVSEEDRSDSIKEHSSRTAQSLVDAFKDLSTLDGTVKNSGSSLKDLMEHKSVVIDDDSNSDTEGLEEKEEVVAEDVFIERLTNRLMGRETW